MVIEAVTGQDYRDVIRDKVLAPLGLAGDVFVGVPASQRERCADTYAPEPRDNSAEFKAAGLPSGGGYATARGMAAFYQMLLGRDRLGDIRLLLPRLICRLTGLPRPGRDVPVTVSFHPDQQGGEYRRRRFVGRRYASGFSAGPRGREGLLLERFFPFRLYHRLTPGPQGLAWRLVASSLCGVPRPRWTLPRVNCLESGDGDRFRFDIEVAFPIVGPVIHYRGWLLPQT